MIVMVMKMMLMLMLMMLVLRMNMMYSSFSLTKIIIDYVLAIGNEKEFPHVKYTRLDLEF